MKELLLNTETVVLYLDPELTVALPLVGVPQVGLVALVPGECEDLRAECNNNE